jgi:hypothetical protein
VRVLPDTSPRGVHTFALPPHAALGRREGEGLMGGGLGGGGDLAVATHSRCDEQERRAEEGEEKGGGKGGGGGGEHGLKRVSYIRDLRTNRSASAAVPPPLPV